MERGQKNSKLQRLLIDTALRALSPIARYHRHTKLGLLQTSKSMKRILRSRPPKLHRAPQKITACRRRLHPLIALTAKPAHANSAKILKRYSMIELTLIDGKKLYLPTCQILEISENAEGGYVVGTNDDTGEPKWHNVIQFSILREGQKFSR